MRQSYFIWVILFWFVGNHLLEEIQSNYDPRLYANVNVVPRVNGTSRTTAFNKPQVPNNDDLTRLYVNKEAAVGGDGSSWATAFKYLQDALATAGSGTEIWVAKGSYFPDEGNGQNTNNRSSSFKMKSDVKLYGGFAGGETQLSQRNWFNNTTYLSGDLAQNDETAEDISENAYHVVEAGSPVVYVNENAVLDGFIITGGNANGASNDINGYGGGMLNRNTYVDIENCEFRNNFSQYGGGLANYQDASPYIINCFFRGNSANIGGGGVYNRSSVPYFNDCVFSGNYANPVNNGVGGGLYNIDNSEAAFVNCTFNGNSSAGAGAVYTGGNSVVKLFNTIIWENAENNLIYTPGASVYTVPNSNSSIEYVACLVQNLNLEGSNQNMDGTLPANNPLFTISVDPSSAPTTSGSLLPLACSPVIDKGNNEYESLEKDIILQTRNINGIVDLGAYEVPENLGIVYVNRQATGNNDGTSWDNAFNKLQDALALNCTDITQIWVAKGFYFPDEGDNQINDDRHASFIMKPNVAMYGGFIGGETDLSQRDWKTNKTYLSGDIDQSGFGFATISGNSIHVIFNNDNGLNSSAVLDGFMIYGGNANLTADPFSTRGSAMYNFRSSPTVRNCVFFDNTSLQGGALVTHVINQPMTITNTKFVNNRATGIGGGAIFNLGGASGLLLISNCSFNSNRAVADGGAIHSISNNMKIINSEFIWNWARNGSAIGNTNASPNIINCSFSGNTATTETNPSVIYNEGSSASPSSPIITNCIIWGNGNAIFNDISSNPVVTFSSVEGGYVGNGNLNVDPLFVDAFGGDLHLQNGSPCVNTGNDAVNTEPFDLDGQTRIVGVIDMGAYEFGSSTPGCTDETAPAFTGSYADENLGCNPENPDGSLGTATATDASGTVTITSQDGSVVSDGCNQSRTRTFTATDGCFNTSTTSRTVRWIEDVTPPVFTGAYFSQPLGCNPDQHTFDHILGRGTATDVCGDVTITFQDELESNGCDHSLTRTFTATDACNNTATKSRTISWINHASPSFIDSYADVNLGCNPGDPNNSLGTAAATDACDDVTITSADGPVVSDGCSRSLTRTFTAKDGCNSTSTVSRTVRWVVDVTPPTFIGSYADLDLGCNPGNPDGSLGTATATDGCGDVTITSSDGAVVSNGCNRSRTRTFIATDGCLNTSTTSRTVRWTSDNTPPAFTGNNYADVNLGCNPGNPDGSLGTATATDGCGAVTITSSDGVVVSNGCNRSRTRTFTATDGCLNTSTISRTVRWIADLTPPAFTGYYSDVNIGCNPGNPDGSLGTATAIDVCGAVTITSSDGAVVSNGCNRSRTRTFTATDGCLNTSTTSRTVRWISDNTPPPFTGSYADVNLGCNPANPDGSLGTATATDGCGAVTITSSDGIVVSNGCNRARTRTFTATDGCLNTSTISRTVRWIADLTPPAFTGYYSDVNLGCNPGNPDGSLGTATATDGCGAVTITSSDGAVVSNGCNRSRTRTFTATDGCLNTSTTSRTVRWIADITPPSFTGYYSDVNLNCNPANPDGSLGTATATDGCGAVTITSSDGAVVSNGCNRSRTRIFTATDGCLNTSTTSRTVRWIYDVTAPTLICAKTGTVTKSTNQGLCTYTVNGIEFNPTASDVCSTPSLAWNVSDATNTSGNTTMAGVVLNFGNNTIKWTATDDCGNTSTCSFIVNVNKVTTTTSLVVSTTPASNPVTQQYSDKITCVATVTNCPNAGPIGGTVTFKIINAQGTVVLGTAPVASDGTATLTDTLIENQFYPGATNLLPSNGPLKPGNKTVTAEYSGTDPDYIVTNPTAPLVVNCEDAEITYNGLNYFGANPNTNQGTITVSAFVLDTNDVNDIPAQARGDIRNATVTFKEGTSGGVAIGTTNIPVGLVNPTNFQEGIVTTNKTYTLTTQDINCGGKIVDVWAGVNNYYCGEIAEVVPVCLSLPGGDFVTGGGWIKMLNSEGSYAGTDDQKMHAALAFKWNKSNKNLQGNATIVYKRIVNGVQKVYQVKSNSITSMIVNNVNDLGTAVATGATYRMAQIITKANFRDITDPELPVALFGNLTLTITAWESIATTDGSKDRITVELVGSGSQGLIFSSNWLSGATQWQQLNSGKIRVRNPSAEIPCTNCSGSGITTRTGEVDKATETIPATEDLKVTVMPNPSSTNFRITVNSNDLKEPVKLLITDMLGRVIETRITNAGQIITIGNKYISGTYAVRILQGRKTRQLTLIKLSD